MFKERRDFPRIDVLAQIKVEMGNEIYLMKVRNLSQSGAFVLNEHPEEFMWIRIGERLNLDLFSTDDAAKNLRVKGLIVRIADSAEPDERGFGISFTDTRPEAREEIEKLIELCRIDRIFSSPTANP